MIKRIPLIAILLFLTFCCTNELVTPQLKDKQGLSPKTENFQTSMSEIIVDDSHPVWNQIQDNETIELEDETYIFNRPIIISDITNLKITTSGGGKARLLFRFDGAGIQVNNSNGIIIENIEIDNFIDYGNYTSYFKSGYNVGRIDVRSSNNVEIKESVIGQLNTAGDENSQVYIFNSTNCKVQNCLVYRAKGELISIIGSNDCIVSENTIYGGNSVDGGTAFSGIETAGSNYMGWYRGYRNRIINNQVYDCVAAFITINDREAWVEGNLIDVTQPNQMFGPGIRLGHFIGTFDTLRAAFCVVKGNTIRNLDGIDTPPGSTLNSYDPYGIRVDASRTDAGGTALLEGNTIENCTGGIQISDLPGQTVTAKGNTVIAHNFAFNVWGLDTNPHHIELDSNIVNIDTLGAEFAIGLTNATGSIKRNKIFGSKIGIKMEKAENVLVDDNYIRETRDYCINLINCTSINVTNNSGSIKYSAVVLVNGGSNLHFDTNWLWLLEGNSLYAIYASGSFSNLTVINNTHNYPYLKNF
jgi:hypothetical protein